MKLSQRIRFSFFGLGLVFLLSGQNVDGFTRNFWRNNLPTLPTLPTLQLPLLPPIKLEILPAVTDGTEDLTPATDLPAFSDENYSPVDNNVDILRPTPTAAPVPTPDTPILQPSQPENPNNNNNNRDDGDATDLGTFIIQKLTNIEQKLDLLREELRKTQASIANQNANIEKIQPATEDNLSEFARMLSENISSRLGHIQLENVTEHLPSLNNNTEDISSRIRNVPTYPFGIPSLPSSIRNVSLSSITPPFVLPSFPALDPKYSNNTDLPPLVPPVVVPAVITNNPSDTAAEGTTGGPTADVTDDKSND